jgi:isoamylase
MLLINMYIEGTTFSLPATSTGMEWRRIIDTAAWAEPASNCWQPA